MNINEFHEELRRLVRSACDGDHQLRLARIGRAIRDGKIIEYRRQPSQRVTVAQALGLPPW